MRSRGLGRVGWGALGGGRREWRRVMVGCHTRRAVRTFRWHGMRHAPRARGRRAGSRAGAPGRRDWFAAGARISRARRAWEETSVRSTTRTLEPARHRAHTQRASEIPVLGARAAGSEKRARAKLALKQAGRGGALVRTGAPAAQCARGGRQGEGAPALGRIVSRPSLECRFI